MAEKKIHKGYRLTQETLQEMKDISEWYGDIDQTQVLTIAVAEMWHRRAGETDKGKKGQPGKKNQPIKKMDPS
jgi:hypothetical protein